MRRGVSPHAAGCVAILVAAFAARWPFRGAGLIRDEGEYLHLSQALRGGVVPYLELYNQKPPFALAFVALEQTLFGESLEALRVATTLWVLLGGALIAATAWRFISERAALLALAAYCLMSFDQAGIVHAASTEALMLPWLAAGLGAWLVARGGAGPRGLESEQAAGSSRGPMDRMGWAIAAGACAALAVQTKQTGIALLAAIVADGILSTRQHEIRRYLAGVIAGFALTSLAVLATLWALGALGAYLDAAWVHNFSYVGRRHAGLSSWLALLASLGDVARQDVGFWCVGGVAALWLLGTRRFALRSVGLLGLATLGTALLAGQAYAHYYTPLIAPLALAFAALGEAAAKRLRTLITSRRGAAATAGAWGLAAVGIVATALPFVAPLRHHVAALSAPAAFMPTSSAAAIGRYLAEQTDEAESVLVLGSEPQIYFYASRPAATRFPHMYPLTGPYPHAAELQLELSMLLRSRPPRYVVYISDWRSHAETRERAEPWQRDVLRVLERRYRPVREFEGGALVLRLRE